MLHQTALHATHEALGATLVDFGGWDMPLWYPTGAVKEHLAVIQHAGLFDIGHMAGLMVSGPDALEALQWAFTKDLSLSGPRAAYGAFLDASGGVVDDAIVYPLSEGRYFVVLNVGKGERIAESLSAWAASEGKSVTIRDLAGTYGKLDLQGPATVRVMTKLLKDPEAVFDKLPYFSFKGDMPTAIFSLPTVRRSSCPVRGIPASRALKSSFPTTRSWIFGTGFSKPGRTKASSPAVWPPATPCAPGLCSRFRNRT